MRRFAAAPILLLILILTLAARAVAVTPPTIVLTKVEPEIAAIRGGGTSIEIRDPAEELLLFDAKGQPFLKMNSAGVQERMSGGDFEEVRKEHFFYLHDGHLGQAVTDRKSLPYPWQIKGTYGGKSFVMEGTLVPAGAREGDAGAGRMGLFLAVLLFGLVVTGIVGVVVLIRSFLRRS